MTAKIFIDDEQVHDQHLVMRILSRAVFEQNQHVEGFDESFDDFRRISATSGELRLMRGDIVRGKWSHSGASGVQRSPIVPRNAFSYLNSTDRGWTRTDMAITPLFIIRN